MGVGVGKYYFDNDYDHFRKLFDGNRVPYHTAGMADSDHPRATQLMLSVGDSMIVFDHNGKFIELTHKDKL